MPNQKEIVAAWGLILAGVGVVTQFVSKEEDPSKIVNSKSRSTTTTMPASNYILAPPTIK